jgi:CubicO group peptidase (beta-lactamase class C family)/uncharacterized protein YbbC (DUF1343 family)
VDRDGVLFEKAYGDRALVPSREEMTTDTVFDLASLTKPTATTLAIMALVEDGLVDLHARATTYLPELAAKDATVEDLLLHVAGLPADARLPAGASTRQSVLAAALAVAPVDAPRHSLRYSDLGYVALGAIVERVSRERLDAFVARRFYAPLAMTSTRFLPDEAGRSRAAPTTYRAGRMLRGDVHDPRAKALDGVAGHAGLFSTAADLGRLARMLLRGGELDGTRVLASPSVAKMLERHDVAGGARALGWDIHTGYSHERGETFGDDGFGHTGFTGTSMWLDRASGVAVIVLTSRLHPEGRGDAKRVRREVANAVAHAVLGDPRRGIDVLEDHGYRELAGAKLAVLTNDAARDALGQRTLDALAASTDVRVVLTAEHGLAASHEGGERARVETRTGLPIVDVYGGSLQSPDSELRGADTLVVDLPDVGARFFTYAATAAKVADVARARGMRVVVLDRENPLGDAAEGPAPDVAGESLVSFFAVPVRHGKSLGGLLRMRGDVELLSPEGGDGRSPIARGESFLAPSPNLRTAAAEALYPGLALLEMTNVSVGRGTTLPFEQLGAPWMDATALVEALSHLGTGVSATPTRFVPTSGPFAREECRGVRFHIEEESSFRPVRFGIALAVALRALQKDEFDPRGMQLLLAHRATYDAILRGDSLDEIEALWRNGRR